MSILEQGLIETVEEMSNITVESATNFAEAEAELDTALTEYSVIDSAATSFEGLATSMESIINTEGGVTEATNEMYANTATAIVDRLSLEEATATALKTSLGKEVSVEAMDKVKAVIAKIKELVKKAFDAAIKAFETFMVSASNFFTANEKKISELVTELEGIDAGATLKDGALDGVKGKAAVVAYLNDRSSVTGINVSADRIKAVLSTINATGKTLGTKEGMVKAIESIADALVTYTKPLEAGVSKKELTVFSKEGDVTVIGQNGNKFKAIITGELNASVVSIGVDEKANNTFDVKNVKELAKDIESFGNKDEIGKANKELFDTIKNMEKEATSEDEDVALAKALAMVYKIAFSLAIVEAKTFISRSTDIYALGKAVVNGIEKKEEEKKEEEKKEEK